jgi:succinate dehydrogenase / fumarate reductase membrane anchor subunit
MERQAANKGTELGRVRGLGSAHHGGQHWMAMQVSSTASMITTAFLAISFLLLPDLSFEVVRIWLARPLTVTMLSLLVISVFWHARLGLTVMIEDYVHGAGSKFASLLALNLAAFAGMAFGLACLLFAVVGSLNDASAKVTADQVQQDVQTLMQRMMSGGGRQ